MARQGQIPRMPKLFREVLDHMITTTGNTCYIFISKDRTALNFSLQPRFLDDDLAFIIKPKFGEDEII